MVVGPTPISDASSSGEETEAQEGILQVRKQKPREGKVAHLGPDWEHRQASIYSVSLVSSHPAELVQRVPCRERWSRAIPPKAEVLPERSSLMGADPSPIESALS